MKTKLLKRLRREARRYNPYPYDFLGVILNNEGHGAFCRYRQYYLTEIRDYILRRVAELKRKKK